MIRLADIRSARRNLTGIAETTPLNLSGSLSELVGSEVYLKLENLQKTGSFKLRGAANKIMSLGPEMRERGVIAASAGNHAQGVAFGAQRAGMQAVVVMPDGAPLAKVAATRNYGAEVILHGAVYDDAYRRAVELQVERGAVFIHAFDDPEVIAGQGTVGLEILEQRPDVDAIVIPIGGGGLAAGIAVAVKQSSPGVKLIGVQSSDASAMVDSLRQGRLASNQKVSTFADGIAVQKPGGLAFAILSRYLDSTVTVTDEEIAESILTLLERSKVVAEGAGAVAVAAILSGRVRLPGKKVACVVSGGNIDVNFVAQIIERGLAKTGRKVMLSTFIPDRIGTLYKVLEIVSRCKANIINIDHSRSEASLPLGMAIVTLTLETENQAHIQLILEALAQTGYQVKVLN